MDQSKSKEFDIKKITPLQFGVFREKKGFRFTTYLSEDNLCGMYLWKKQYVIEKKYLISLNDAIKIPFDVSIRTGAVYAGVLSDFPIDEYAYCFFVDDKLIVDEYARGLLNPVMCNIEKKQEAISILLAYTTNYKFNWGQDLHPQKLLSESIIYGLHVKGYTKHVSSNVKHKGTYQGLTEKISYIKQLGITTIECMPVNEFITEETPNEKDRIALYTYREKIPSHGKKQTKINYWGFKEGCYFAPKASYASTESVQYEFKNMVKKIHQNDLEIILQFYFPEDVRASLIIDALRFWVMEYHVDGFRIIGSNLPKKLISEDGILARTKIIFDQYQNDLIIDKPSNKNIAITNSGYTDHVRKYLKGDEYTAQDFVNHMYQRGKDYQRINFITDYQGFSLADLVSYDRKHNEANEENNKDGTDYNFSWNCGEEGPTKKRKIQALRKKQMSNALIMLLLAQGTPYIKAGDEFANTQKGNNNPYCQDNEITWINWNLYKRNRKQVQFVKELITLRKEHPILHVNKNLRVMDYLGCGYPDVSFHGQEAWRPILDHVSRQVGILYCGKYARVNDSEDEFIYIVYNMHWYPHEFAIPRLPKGKIWKQVINTNSLGGKKEESEKCVSIGENTEVYARSIQIYISEEI
jgi:glycogen operon protein